MSATYSDRVSRPRVVMAGLFHETHTFVEKTTGLEDFQICCGEEMLACCGDSSPLGAALQAAIQSGWLVLPTVDVRAMPSGLVEDEVVERFWKEFYARASSAFIEGVDGIFVVLHGAMVSESFPDVEGEILSRIRKMPGAETVPLYGVFDLHANFTQLMATNSNGLIAYRKNPHTDGCASAERAFALLNRAQTDRTHIQTYWRHPPIVWPPTGTGTANEPMRSLESIALDLEKRFPEFWSVNVIAGFSYSDTADTGISFTVNTPGDRRDAEAALDQLCQRAWDLREQGNVIDPPASEVIQWAIEHPLPGLNVFAEPSDNIGAGAIGNGTGLLREFLALGVHNAALAMTDPHAVRMLESLTPGDRMTLAFGGQGNRFDQGPVTLLVELVSRSNGNFTIQDKRSHLASASGDHFSMGPCAVVRHAGITILLTSRPTPPMDLAQWTSQGIDPSTFSYLGVKAAVAHRCAYEPIAVRMFSVETPGPCTSRLQSLPYQRITHPIFPLDEGSFSD